MKTHTKILISICAGVLAMLLATPPMWWGVLFSPVTQQLTCTSFTEDTESGWYWQSENVVLRLKSLDLIATFFSP